MIYNTEIKMTVTELIKNPNTKTTYLTEDITTKIITPEQYDNIVSDDTLKFFRRLGGSEYVARAHTESGYLIYKLISTSLDKEYKTIREFEFKS